MSHLVNAIPHGITVRNTPSCGPVYRDYYPLNSSANSGLRNGLRQVPHEVPLEDRQPSKTAAKDSAQLRIDSSMSPSRADWRSSTDCSPKKPLKELHDRHDGGQHDQPIPDTPPLVWVLRERPTSTSAWTHRSSPLAPCLDAARCPYFWIPPGVGCESSFIHAPLSSTALSSQLTQQPRRVVQTVIKDSPGHIEQSADERVAQRVSHGQILPSAPTRCPGYGARPVAATRSAGPARVPPAAPAPYARLARGSPGFGSAWDERVRGRTAP